MENKYSQRTPRKQLIFYLDVLDQSTHERLGHLGDISKDGVMIITEKPLALNSISAISIQLPDLEEFSKKIIDCVVDARWTKPDLNQKLHCIGCRFTKISAEDLLLIENIEEVLGFND